ncbi:Arc family DNA-binding protein [Xenorhabdus bovienii]|uniref:Arc family DNA-binding protein n=1 Tax=Xenorhabdus bovienii TaxID=40576 RepID=UPI00237D1BCC|nr:Arc family DNA-binding protein [Xenorhabdus bovienii]MDE1484302.1 Arc family DNA-binding protein [Xenorhabdus bovienii]
MKKIREISPYSIRMPDELKEKLTKRAKKNGRSLNSEMVMILQSAVDEDIQEANTEDLSPKDAVATFQSEMEEFKRLLSKKQEDILTLAKIFAEWSSKKDK